MSSLRDDVIRAIGDIPFDVTALPAADDGDSAPDDEIVAAVRRQLDVLEGSTVLLGNLVQMIQLQVQNLRAEVAAFDTPPPQPVITQPQPPTRTASGALVEASLPEEERPTWCLHPDALIIDTVSGKVKVCPECDP